MAKFEPILENYLVKDNRDLLAFRKLSENEKVDMSKELVDSVYKATTERAMSLDYDDVSQSAGDITKIKDYQTLVDSINLLTGMQSYLHEKIDDLDTIVTAHQNLVNNLANFEQGFRVGNTGVIMLYNNLAMSLVASTSFVIATTVDYVKDPVGNYSAHFRNNASMHRGHPTIMLDSLKKFNTLSLNGDLVKFFEYSFSKKALVGFATGTTAAILAVGIGLSIIPIIRELVYQFYHIRVSFSDYVRLQSSFIEMNRVKLGTSKDVKGVSKKQEQVVKNLNKLADKVDVDQKTSTKKAQNDLKRENSTATLHTPAVAAQNDYSYDNLL